MSIKHILSDLDGVLRHFPNQRNHEIETKFGLAPGVLLATAFKEDLLFQVITGVISDERWRELIVSALNRYYPREAASSAVAEWSDFPGEVDRRYLDVLESKLPGTPISLLTNATSRLGRDLKALAIETLFFRIFNSSEVGLCKPNPKLYLHTIQELGCQSEEILFIDDSASNIAAAGEAGMQTHHFTSIDSLIKAKLS